VLLSRRIDYFQCRTCGYVQTEDPYWLEEAYSSAINTCDTGIMVRNLANSRIVLGSLWLMGSLDEKVVDCAGGYGILVRLLRDLGIDALWADRYCGNLLARGFEHSGEKATLVTAFEAFEHFVDPKDELRAMLDIAPSVLLSTEIIPNPTPAQDAWWYYGKDHGQHIGFFRLKTLEKLAARFGKKLLTDGRSYHLITDHPVNENLWNFLVKLNRFVPMMLNRKLKSKTWADFEMMSILEK
jgi:hypothetical protein